MYGKILVAVDGSPSSLNALSHAVQIAEKHGSTLHVVSVVDELKLPFKAQYRLWARESHRR